MEKNGAPYTYLLMDQSSVMLAQSVLQDPENDHNLQMKITQGLADDVVRAEVVQAVPLDMGLPVYLGRVIFRRGNLVVLEPLQKLGREVRRNLRVPVAFTTYIYPPGGGRAAVLSENISCGGISFQSTYPLQKGDQCEIVIPITREPLILDCRVLRVKAGQGDVKFYAAEFSDVINDQETLLRAAVFGVQLNSKALNPRKR